jgi:hypothetical protein
MKEGLWRSQVKGARLWHTGSWMRAVPGVVEVPRDRGDGGRDLPGGGEGEGQGQRQEPEGQQGRRRMRGGQGHRRRRAAGRDLPLAGESPKVEPPARALRLRSLFFCSLCAAWLVG